VYFIYQTRIKSAKTDGKPEAKDEINSGKNNQDIPLDNNDYENVEDDHSTYTALKRPGPGEPSDDHVYASLNQAAKNVEKTQGETVL
jgi:hypothetical protein